MSNGKEGFRPKGKQDQVSGGVSAEDQARWPALSAYVTGCEFAEGGEEIPPGTIMFYVERGVLTVCFMYKDTPWRSFTAIDSLHELQDVLEGLLARQDLVWKEKPGNGPRRH